MQQLRRINNATPPTTLLAGEIAYHQAAAAGGAAGDLYIGDGNIAQLLVGPTKVWTLTNFHIDGGANTDLLTTNGSGTLSWVARSSVGMTSVNVSAPITGNGAATPLALSVAAAGDVTVGTNNVLPITSLTLHGVTGTLSALDTTHKTSLVGAINEVLADLGSATAGGLSAVAVASPLVGTGTGAIGSSANPVGLSTVPINLGGTNGTTALAALDNLTGGSGTVTGVPHRTATAWVVGPVPITDGGTGATTAAGSLDALSGASGATAGHLSRSGTGVWSVDTATYLTTVSVSAPITGNGAGTALGLTIASAGDVTGGTDNTNPVSSLRLREVTGALTGLTAGITNTNLVAAINSIHGQVAALSNPLRFAGTFNASTNLVEAGGLHPAGAVQAPSAANEGWVLIVGTAGTPAAGPAPTRPLTVGDWIISTGAGGTWTMIDLDLHAVAAANVSVTGIAGVTDVQTGLTQIFAAAGGNISVLTDGASIIGTGRTGAALEVGTVDAGTY